MQVFDTSYCTSEHVLQEVPHQIWQATTASGDSLPVWLVRLFHNKLRYYPINYLQCYTNYFSPQFVFDEFGLLITLFIIVGIMLIYRHLPFLKWPLLIAIALYPFVFIFELY